MEREEIKKLLDAELDKISVFASGKINSIPINSDLGCDLIKNIINNLSQLPTKEGEEEKWLSPVKTERDWQEEHIKKIWKSYPNSCPNWQILNGLIRLACNELDIELTPPKTNQ